MIQIATILTYILYHIILLHTMKDNMDGKERKSKVSGKNS